MGERDVKYDTMQFDELPARESGGTGGSSVLETKLAEVRDNVEHGKWACIAQYAKPSAASAAANVIRKRYGANPKPYGWTVAVRKVDAPTGERRQGLFVRYTPDEIVEGEAAVQDQRRAEWEAHQKELNKQSADKRAAAKAANGGEGRRQKSKAAS